MREYVLIGEAEGGICGEQGTTWGPHWLPRLVDAADSSQQQLGGGRRCKGGGDGAQGWEAPDAVVHEGFMGVELPALSGLQICGSDERWQCGTNSRTVSFRRQA